MAEENQINLETQQSQKFAFENLISKYKEAVLLEQKNRMIGYKSPEVNTSSSLSPEQLEIAKRLVEVQAEKGVFGRKDISEDDYNKIKVYAKRYGKSFKEAVSDFVLNERYISPEYLEALNICDAAQDIRNVAEEYAEKFGGIPVNILSAKTRDYFSNKKIKLNLVDKVKIFIEMYCPELAGVNLIERSNLAYRQKNFVRNEELLNDRAEFIKSNFSDKNQNIDSIFSPENRKFLQALFIDLRKNNISFDEFITSYAKLDYTKIYKANMTESLKLMIDRYFRKWKTHRGITNNDEYLRSKIDIAEECLGIRDLSELLIFLNIENDAFNNAKSISKIQLSERKNKILNQLNRIFPNKIIDESLSTKYVSLYNEILNISRRLGYNNIGDYLEVLGFKRVNEYGKAKRHEKIQLTERDFFFYEIINPQMTPAQIEKTLKKLELELVDLDGAVSDYQKYVYGKEDSSKIKHYEELKVHSAKLAEE